MKKNTVHTKKVRKRRTDDDILAIYLNEINKINLMSREEEEKYARRAAKGDEKAKRKLINANLRFVVNVAKRYQNQGLPIEDLISEGNIGLMNAIDKFDVDMGYHFISYAVWWIRQSILKSICEKKRMIRLPMNRVYEISKIEKAKDQLQNVDSMDKKIEEIAKQLNMDKKEVADLMNISRDMISLEMPIYIETDSASLINFIEDKSTENPTDFVINRFLQDDINHILKDLPGKEAAVLERRFGLNGKPSGSLTEVGNEFKLTKERIRQIEARAIERLKADKRMDKLKIYMS
ncbi:MAG: RNA polymerase sigma factor RpoD/SigA [Spirochaetales bacterium]|nr:RNA polymerase sigma factor RpoD/SigA [Spirochaetales bacterium]